MGTVGVPLRIGSLFSGYEGLGMGVQVVLGGDLTWVSDIDKGACKILAHRFPDVPNLGDITAVDWVGVEPVDVLTGGFPCQDVSAAGKRAGIRPGTRSGLWTHFAYAISQLQPALVVIENVRGLLSATAERNTSDLHECLCGGLDRRGGLDRSTARQGHVSGPRNDRDDPARQTDADGAEGSVERLPSVLAASDSAMGRGVGLERRGFGCSGVVGRDPSVSAHQGGAGHVGTGSGAAQVGTAEKAEWLGGLEHGHAHSVSTNQGGPASAEPERPQVCRECGGTDRATVCAMESSTEAVGDGSGEPVLRALGAVLGDLADLGYDAAWCGLRAADVGAPHGRFRVFILAWPAADADGGFLVTGSSRADQRSVPSCYGRSTGRHSLLPSPCTSDTNGAGQHRNGGLDLRTAVSLLPTPRAGDGTKGGPNQRGSSGDLMLPSAVQLLPTPAVNDMGEGKTVEVWDTWTAKMKALHGNGNGHGASLAIEAQRAQAIANSRASWAQRPDLGSTAKVADWGRYAEAITRWQTLTGPTPAPTEPGSKGSPRLSAAFSEWLMGVPAGWITEVPGITRNEALKACGNGVVPQQAAEAVRRLLPLTPYAHLLEAA